MDNKNNENITKTNSNKVENSTKNILKPSVNIENNSGNINDIKETPVKSNKKDKKKSKSFKLCLLLLFNIIFVIGFIINNEVKKEFARLSEINKEKLDLKMIIDTTEYAGGTMYQLNWKEVTAIAGVVEDNYIENVNKSLINNITKKFIDKNNGRIKSLDEVISMYDFNKREKQRVYDYLEDLEFYGYTPERLTPESKQMLFINSIKDSCIENYYSSKILPSVTIAQAILESNWGDSNLTKEANNLFGIKVGYNWKGESVTFETNEFHNTMIRDKFRKYDTISDSIDDHANFLIKNPRYEQAGVFDAKNYKAQALALQNAGYSTAEDENGNKTYADMLGQIIRQYNLQIIDASVLN